MIEFPSSRKRDVIAHKMGNLRSNGSRLSALKARDDRLAPRPERRARHVRHADAAARLARSGKDARGGLVGWRAGGGE